MKRLVLILMLFAYNIVAMEETNGANSALKERDAKEKESYKTVKMSKQDLLKSIKNLEDRVKKVEKLPEQCRQEMAKALKEFREGSDRSEDAPSSSDIQESNTMEIIGGMAAIVAIAGFFYFK